MQFFTSSNDLKKWVKSFKTPDEASLSIMEVIGKNEEQDIVQTCRSILNGDEDAATILFGILSRHNITQLREGNMKDKLVKQAQAVMRTDSLYGNMDMRICPKLPKQSAGHGLISTYNCRTYCLDSVVFDDDPTRVYCNEALWRRHIMDKFSREFKDKDGKWVGGYINQRFQVFHDDGGNQMELAHGERTRKPRPHQYSTERRLEEGRGEKTTDLTASSTTFIKLASLDKRENNDSIYNIFDDIIEMKQAGISDEDIIYKVAEHYNVSIPAVANINKSASKMIERHDGMIYAHDNSKMVKTAQEKENELFQSLTPELKRKAHKLWVSNLHEMLSKYVGQREKLIQDLTLASSSKTTKTAQASIPDQSSHVSKSDVSVVDKASGQKMELPINTRVSVAADLDPKWAVLKVDSGALMGKQVLCDKAIFAQSFGMIEDAIMKKDTLPNIDQQDTSKEDADALGLNEEADFPVEQK